MNGLNICFVDFIIASFVFFFFQAEDGIRDIGVTGSSDVCSSDLLQEEQTEDVLKLGAVAATEAPYLATGVIATVQQRFGWLLLLFIASVFTSAVNRHYEGLVKEVVALMTFIPLLIGTGGNAGAQAVMTVTRALALGEVRFGDWARVLWREMRTGLLLGSVLACVGFLYILLVWHEGVKLAL